MITRRELDYELRQLAERIHEDRVTAEDDEALEAIGVLTAYLEEHMTNDDFPLETR